VSGPESKGEASAEAQPAGAAPLEPFRLGAEPPHVMRLSRQALAILGGASGIAIGRALLYALQPAAQKAPDNLYDRDRPNRSELVTGAPADYGKVPKLGAPLPGELRRPILAAQQDGEVVPVSPIGTPPGADSRRVAREQARVQLAQEGEAARASQLFLGGSSASTAATPASLDAPSIPGPAAEPGPASSADRRRAFLADATGRPPESKARLADPSSRNILQAGSVILAALVTGIQSDLPGQITAQVTQNVYDSPTGRILLIPQGARLVGDYDSEIAEGQSRVLLAWNRLILPGGRSITLDRLPDADPAGMAGVADRTNYHWGHMLKAALISTLVGVGAELGASEADRLVRAIRGGAQDSINETGRQVVERQLQMQPTITIWPGFDLRILVTRDLILDPATGAAP
jgi:type IV secretion system protein VirB10